ncbi:MAG: hypothetical protein DLM69_02025, partial [Candidatus Chloroheliales bacterium]
MKRHAYSNAVIIAALLLGSTLAAAFSLAPVAASGSNSSTINYTLGGRGVVAPLTLSFAPHVEYAANGGAVSAAVADFNHDGIPDLAVADAYVGYVSVLLGNADGSFGS